MGIVSMAVIKSSYNARKLSNYVMKMFSTHMEISKNASQLASTLTLLM